MSGFVRSSAAITSTWPFWAAMNRGVARVLSLMLGFALVERRSSTTPRCPFSAPRYNGVAPSGSLLLTTALRRNNDSAMPRDPLAAAMWSGVAPFHSACGSALRRSSRRVTLWSLLAQAICSGVEPSRRGASIAALLSSRNLTHGACPCSAARDKAEAPLSMRASSEARARTSEATVRRCPLRAATCSGAATRVYPVPFPRCSWRDLPTPLGGRDVDTPVSLVAGACRLSSGSLPRSLALNDEADAACSPSGSETTSTSLSSPPPSIPSSATPFAVSCSTSLSMRVVRFPRPSSPRRTSPLRICALLLRLRSARTSSALRFTPATAMPPLWCRMSFRNFGSPLSISRTMSVARFPFVSRPSRASDLRRRASVILVTCSPRYTYTMSRPRPKSASGGSRFASTWYPAPPLLYVPPPSLPRPKAPADTVFRGSRRANSASRAA